MTTTIDRTGCGAPRHGTVNDYRYGCRCPAAREDKRLTDKRRREGRHRARLVPGIGSRRRLQALNALGWTLKQLAAELGWSIQATQAVTTGVHPLVRASTRDAIAALYDRLGATRGPSEVARTKALRRGYMPPQAWDDDIDNPAAAPLLDAPADPTYVDGVLVARVLDGKAPAAALSRAERAAAVQLGKRRGMPQYHLIRVLQISGTTLAGLATQEAA